MAAWKYVSIGLAMFMLCGCGDLVRKSLQQASEKVQKEQAERQRMTAEDDAATGADAEAAELLGRAESIAEAKAWLAPNQTNHWLWKGDRDAMIRLVDSLYAAGALAVHAVEILKEGDQQIAATFVVTLPEEPSARGRVLKVHNDFWNQHLAEEAEEDRKSFLAAERGQKYLVLDFDL